MLGKRCLVLLTVWSARIPGGGMTGGAAVTRGITLHSPLLQPAEDLFVSLEAVNIEGRCLGRGGSAVVSFNIYCERQAVHLP